MKNMSCKLVVSVTLFFSFLAVGPLAHAQNSSEKEVIVVYKNKAGKETSWIVMLMLNSSISIFPR
ncbi:Minor extracellular protease Epr [Bacillus subtilis]|nr:Minor extracellular protease Epr [Bacillus subtilis]CAF1748614.1 Minor extracellular protease Epr [Bacillus subtilis]